MSNDLENPVADVLARKSVDIEELEEFEFEKDTSSAYVTDVVGRVAKERRYVSDPSEVPEGQEAQEGPQGGTYYETGEGDTDGSQNEEESGTEDSGSKFNVEDEGDLFNVWREGWDQTTDDRGVLADADISYGEFAERVEAVEQEMSGAADTIAAAGVVIDELLDEHNSDTDDSFGEDLDSMGRPALEEEAEEIGISDTGGMSDDELREEIREEQTGWRNVNSNPPADLEDGSEIRTVNGDEYEFVEYDSYSGSFIVEDENGDRESIRSGMVEAVNTPDNDSSDEGRTLWEDELATNYEEGDEMVVDTERVGEISGSFVEYYDEYDELVVEGDDGQEYIIPTDDIEGLESN